MLNKIALLPKASALVEEATQQSNIHEDTKYARTIELWFNQLSVTLLLAPSCTLCVCVWAFFSYYLMRLRIPLLFAIVWTFAKYCRIVLLQYIIQYMLDTDHHIYHCYYTHSLKSSRTLMCYTNTVYKLVPIILEGAYTRYIDANSFE